MFAFASASDIVMPKRIGWVTMRLSMVTLCILMHMLLVQHCYGTNVDVQRFICTASIASHHGQKGT